MNDKLQQASSLITELAESIEEAHDTHIYAPDDPHPADCGYCELTTRAKQFVEGLN